MTKAQRRFIFIPLLLIYLLALFSLALWPSTRTSVQLINLVPFSSILRGLRQGGPLFVINVVGNIVVFTPLGWLLPALTSRADTLTRTLVIGFAVSLTIELLQLISAQRVADVDDLLLNVAGTFLGYLVYVAIKSE